MSVWRARRITSGPCLLCLWLLAARPSSAHGDLHEKIAALTSQIARDPSNADLYIRRGEAHRAHRDWRSALADFDRAEAMRPDLRIVDLLRGLTFLGAEKPDRACLALDRFLAEVPDHAGALVARARARALLGRHRAAAEDFTRAIAVSSKPRPEYFIERARALIAAEPGRTDDALRGLDDGIRILGPVVTLQLFAVELELQKRRYDAVLRRLDQIAAQSERKEIWLARRGDVLKRAGRSLEARHAYAAALAAIETLTSPRRNTKTIQELETRLRSELGKPAGRSSSGMKGDKHDALGSDGSAYDPGNGSDARRGNGDRRARSAS